MQDKSTAICHPELDAEPLIEFGICDLPKPHESPTSLESVTTLFIQILHGFVAVSELLSETA